MQLRERLISWKLGSFWSALSGSERRENALTMFSLVPPKMLSWLRMVLWLRAWVAGHLFFLCVACRSLVGEVVLCLRMVVCVSGRLVGVKSYPDMMGMEVTLCSRFEVELAAALSIFVRMVQLSSFPNCSSSHFSIS
jgi:hypothetical protein